MFVLPFVSSKRTRTTTLSLLLSFLFLFGLSNNASAVPTKDTSTSGDWNTAGNWTPAGVPVSGDSVNIDLSMTVNSSASFGDNTSPFEPSLWGNGGSGIEVTVVSGEQLTHVAGSILQGNGTQKYISGPGTFRNEGTFLLGAGRFLLFQNGVTVDNAGAVEFTENGGHMEIRSGTNFNNLAGGTVTVNLAEGDDFARVYGVNNFNISGGSKFLFNQGILSYGFTENGTMDDTAFDNTFDATTLNSTDSRVYLTGSYDAVNFTNATNLDNVRLGSGLDTSTSNTFTAAAGGTSINVTHTDGIHVSSDGDGTRYSVFSGGSGSTITNEATSKIVVEHATNFFHIGDGTFINEGTMELARNRFLFWQNSPAFHNSGTMEFTGTGSGTIELNSASSEFRNLLGGQITVNMDSINDSLRISSPETSAGGQFINQGDAITLQSGTVGYEPGNVATVNDASLATLFDISSLNAASRLFLGGKVGSIELTAATDLTHVRLGAPFSTSTTANMTADTGGTTLNFSGPNGITLATNGSTYNIFHSDTGNAFTNVAGSKIIAPNGSNFFLTGSGGFFNEGELEIQNSRVLLWLSGTPNLNNSGEMLFNTNNGRIQVRTGFAFNNSGTIQVNMPSATDVANIDDESSHTGTFTNTGIVEVQAGTFLVDPNITLPQVTANSITGGEWRVLSTGINSTLDIQASGTSGGSLTTIASGASVVLSSSGGGSALFPQLGAVQTLDGEFFVHGDHNQTVGNSMNVSGSLGGDGTFTTAGSIAFSGGILDPSSLSGGAGTLTINGDLSLSNTTELAFGLGTSGVIGSGINDLVEVNGDLVLDGVLDVSDLGGLGTGVYRLFNYTGSLTDNGVVLNNPFFVLDLSVAGQVNLSFVPEPSTGLLLLAGLVFFRRRRKTSSC